MGTLFCGSVFTVLRRPTLQYVATGDVMNGLRKKCFKSLCKICAARGLLPTQTTLKPSDLQRSEVPDYTGGFGAVWKGSSGEKAVAIKKLLVDVMQLEKIKEVRVWTEVVRSDVSDP
jgi:hypothetical protein